MINPNELPQNHGKCPTCKQETGNVRVHYIYYHISKQRTVDLEDALDEVTMSYINNEIGFSEWYSVLNNSEKDELRGLVARLTGRLQSKMGLAK